MTSQGASQQAPRDGQVAGAQPPHLAAVAPFSVIGDIYRSPGMPGGIFNNGFAETWLEDRGRDAQPAPRGGQAWAIRQVDNGDTTWQVGHQPEARKSAASTAP